jgi:hypothetical protein
MHSYQIEEDIKVRKILIAVIISIFAAYTLSVILRAYPKISLWWIDYPSVLGFYGIFIWLFDNYFWKSNLIQNWSWLCTPNLGGVWDVEIRSSFDNFETPVQCKMYIKQTGSKILISLDTETSISHSVHAAILNSEKLHDYELMFNYINEPKGDSKSSLNIHYGTSWLQISPDQSGDGEYFTGRGRQTFGRIKITKKSEQK